MDYLGEIGFFLMGVGITLLILWYQERNALIYVDCDLNGDGNPHVIKCTVHNKGRGEANDVFVGFNHSLPLDTVIIAKPEIGAEIVESNNPPDPHLHPNASAFTLAFAIRIPRVSAKSSIQFTILTTNKDNVRASKQIEIIHKEIESVLRKFGERIINDNQEIDYEIDIERIILARLKKGNLFTPGNYSYKEGRFPIRFLDEEDHLALAILDDLTKKYKQKYIDVFKTGKEFKASVIRIKKSKGDCTYAIMPPFIKTYVEVKFQMSKLKEKKTMFFYPPVPENY